MRPLAADDETFFCKLYQDRRTMRHIGRPLSPAGASAAFRASLAASRGRSGPWFFTIGESRSSEALGLCAVQKPRRSSRSVEIGLILRRDAQGRGLARRSISMLTAIAFEALPIDTVWVQYRPANSAARRLVRDLGFVQTDWKPPGSKWAHAICIMQRSAWRKLHNLTPRGNTMSSVIGFLESVGRDASLRHAGSRQWAAMMRQERVEPAVRSAILRSDRGDLDVLLETPHKIYCALMTPKPKKAPAKKPAKTPKKAPAKKKPAKKK